MSTDPDHIFHPVHSPDLVRQGLHPAQSRREHLTGLFALLAGGMGAAACAPPRVAGAPGPRDPARRIRVGLLVGARSVQVGARGNAMVTDGDRTIVRLGAGEAVSIEPAGDGLRISGGGTSASADTFTLRPIDRTALLSVAGTPYRGAVIVRRNGGGVNVINDVGMEEYIQGVVGAEIGPSAGSERAALQAQAVVSRTYAVANLGRFETQRFDLRAGVADQAYRGAQTESAIGNRAVRDTAGMVLTYDGNIANVFFHSTCGYATASPEEVFRTVRPRAYLGSVSDRAGRNGPYYCEIAPRFRWRVVWDGAQLGAILRSTVPSALGVDAGRVTAIHDVRVRSTGRSGRATEIRVGVEGGEIPVFGPDVRAVFQTPERRALASTAIQLSTDRRDGRLARLTAAGAGWGHGVGMCQWGAIGRSRAGHDYRTILRAYFPGTEVSR